MNQELRILIIIAAAFGLGLAVLIANPEYRIATNLLSNQDYYPGVDSDTPVSSPLPARTPQPPPSIADPDTDPATDPADISTDDTDFYPLPDEFPHRDIEF
jgi:hypothetical protein